MDTIKTYRRHVQARPFYFTAGDYAKAVTRPWLNLLAPLALGLVIGAVLAHVIMVVL